jgi:3-isopropylmalate/(R)-2-methylmalate dehydratase small subunit
MQPFTTVTGRAAPMPAANIDTDVIMPKQFLKGIDRSGLRDGAFHSLRFDETGAERGDFILNKPGWQHASFLVVGPNFGCGSSREHAVWGLGQLGIRALIGTSFAGIFFDNCARNGLLAISMEAASLERLFALACDPSSNQWTIDLPRQIIETAGGKPLPFSIEASRKDALIQGLDAVGTTLLQRDTIKAFEDAYLAKNAWLTPINPNGQS